MKEFVWKRLFTPRWKTTKQFFMYRTCYMSRYYFLCCYVEGDSHELSSCQVVSTLHITARQYGEPAPP
jgi:hypothetical protein